MAYNTLTQDDFDIGAEETLDVKDQPEVQVNTRSICVDTRSETDCSVIARGWVAQPEQQAQAKL